MNIHNNQAPSNAISLSVVLAAYNEEDCIVAFCEQVQVFLEEHFHDWELIVVNDGSTDNTRSLVETFAFKKPRVKFAHLQKNSGMGAALKVGYRLATKDWVTMLPADGQIQPKEILKLTIHHEQTDLVTTLYQNREYTLFRKVVSLGLRFLTAFIVGTRARTEGNYLVKRSVLDSFDLRSDSFLLNLEIPIRAKKAGCRVKTVYILVSPRLGGVSKAVTGRRVFHTFYELFLLRLAMTKEKFK